MAKKRVRLKAPAKEKDSRKTAYELLDKMPRRKVLKAHRNGEITEPTTCRYCKHIYWVPCGEDNHKDCDNWKFLKGQLKPPSSKKQRVRLKEEAPKKRKRVRLRG